MLKRFSDIISNIIGIHPHTQSYLLKSPAIEVSYGHTLELWPLLALT